MTKIRIWGLKKKLRYMQLTFRRGKMVVFCRYDLPNYSKIMIRYYNLVGAIYVITLQNMIVSTLQACLRRVKPFRPSPARTSLDATQRSADKHRPGRALHEPILGAARSADKSIPPGRPGAAACGRRPGRASEGWGWGQRRETHQTR